MLSRIPRSRRTVVAALVALVAAAGIGLCLLQPWKAFTDTTVNETLPTPTGQAMKDDPMTKGDSPTKDMKETKESPMRPAGPEDLAQGRFVTHEHDTSGTARTVRLADGSDVLRLEGLRTSDGPDVRVYLSTRNADAVQTGLGGGAVELGRLKGNLGNQNYAVPTGTDLSRFHSAVIWCKSFSVSFGAADLEPVRS